MLILLGLVATVLTYPTWPLIANRAQINDLLQLTSPQAKALRQRIEVALRTEKFTDNQFADEFVRFRETWLRKPGEANSYRNFITKLTNFVAQSQDTDALKRQKILQLAKRYQIRNVRKRIERLYEQDVRLLSSKPQDVQNRWGIEPSHQISLSEQLLQKKQRMLQMVQ